MRPFARPHNKRQPWDDVEEEGDLVPAEPEKKKTMDEEGGKVYLVLNNTVVLLVHTGHLFHHAGLLHQNLSEDRSIRQSKRPRRSRH